MQETILDLFQKMKNRETILNKYFNINWDNVVGKTVLDVGPAFGIWAMKAVDNGAMVECVEINPSWCERFKRLTSHLGYNIPITNLDILEYPDTQFDVVFALALWHHVPDYEKLWDKLFQLAKEYLYVEGPIADKTLTDRHKEYGPEKQRAWYWEPTWHDLLEVIRSHGGEITNSAFNENRKRVILEIKI